MNLLNEGVIYGPFRGAEIRNQLKGLEDTRIEGIRYVVYETDEDYRLVILEAA